MAGLSDAAFTLMRLILAFLYACHGAQKLFGVLGGQPQHHGLMLAAAIIEFVGGVLIGFGLLTRIAAFIASGEMAFAYFMVHNKMGFWPIKNHGELAVALCFAFLFIAAHGGGPYSLDKAWRGKS